jgi:hypothetical protein
VSAIVLEMDAVARDAVSVATDALVGVAEASSVAAHADAGGKIRTPPR